MAAGGSLYISIFARGGGGGEEKKEEGKENNAFESKREKVH